MRMLASMATGISNSLVGLLHRSGEFGLLTGGKIGNEKEEVSGDLGKSGRSGEEKCAGNSRIASGKGYASSSAG